MFCFWEVTNLIPAIAFLIAPVMAGGVLYWTDSILPLKNWFSGMNDIKTVKLLNKWFLEGPLSVFIQLLKKIQQINSPCRC